MNFQEAFTQKEMNLLKEVDTKIDNKDYSDMERMEISKKIIDYIMSEPKETIGNMRIEYDSILRKLNIDWLRKHISLKLMCLIS